MSWDRVPGASKSDVVAQLIERYKPIDHEFVANENVLWAVAEDEICGTQIWCFPLAEFDDGWSYTEVPECLGPLRFSCPLRFLNLVPIASRAWRKRVRVFHASTLAQTLLSGA
jgi:hypothetical protein